MRLAEKGKDHFDNYVASFGKKKTECWLKWCNIHGPLPSNCILVLYVYGILISYK